MSVYDPAEHHEQLNEHFCKQFTCSSWTLIMNSSWTLTNKSRVYSRVAHGLLTRAHGLLTGCSREIYEHLMVIHWMAYELLRNTMSYTTIILNAHESIHVYFVQVVDGHVPTWYHFAFSSKRVEEADTEVDGFGNSIAPTFFSSRACSLFCCSAKNWSILIWFSASFAIKAWSNFSSLLGYAFKRRSMRIGSVLSIVLKNNAPHRILPIIVSNSGISLINVTINEHTEWKGGVYPLMPRTF